MEPYKGTRLRHFVGKMSLFPFFRIYYYILLDNIYAIHDLII